MAAQSNTTGASLKFSGRRAGRRASSPSPSTKTGRRYLIFDPTWEKTAFGQLEHNLQGGYGVLVEGNDSQIIQFPVLSPDLNTIRRTATFQLQPDGSLKGTVNEKRFGDVSERRSSSVKDNVLHYTRTYTVREVTLPADKYPDVQKLAGVIAADEQSSAVLKKQ
jgi:hypothetical protein